MPTMCEGSNFSNGNRKPVTLVSIVVSRKSAVMPGSRCEPKSPNRTTKPETIPIRLMMTCTIVKADRLIPRTMTRSPFPEAPLPQANATIDRAENPALGRADLRPWTRASPINLQAQYSMSHRAVANRDVALCRLPTKKFNQSWNDLAGCFLHQPVPRSLDENPLDLSRHHPAL